MRACAALDCVYELCDADGGRELRKSGYADGVHGVHVDCRGRLKREGGEEVVDWERGLLVARQRFFKTWFKQPKVVSLKLPTSRNCAINSK